MCIIVAKDKGMRCPTEKELKECFTNNPDGAGFMYVDGGKVIIDKGYMYYPDFIRQYKNLCKRFNNFKDKSLVIHCRIGTSGGNTPGNTHPYPLTKSVKEMQKIDNKCDIGIAHNGIIRDYIPLSDKYNDTQEFIKTWMVRIYKEDKNFYKRSHYLKEIEDITNSRFAILDKDDNLHLAGTFITDNNLKFSNTTYKSYTERFYPYSKGKTYPVYYGYHDAYYDYK